MVEIGIKILFNLIEEKTGYNIIQLGGSNRKQELVHIRRVIFVICRDQLGLSLEKAGDIVNRNHATVLSSVNKHYTEIYIYKDYKKLYEMIFEPFKRLYLYEIKHNIQCMKKEIRVSETRRLLIDNQISYYLQTIEKREKQINQIN